MTRRTIVEDAVAHTDPLHIKYRPKTLMDVFGQNAVVASLKTTLKARARPHCFLFTGPAGTGKTTFSMILAADFKCGSIVEVDAASNSGIDDMRKITEALAYNGFGDNPAKAIILNECQGLSKQAWDSLLTTTENCPEHVYFFFTSTHPAKIPAAMVTRCQTYHLAALKYDDILDVLEDVVKAERLDVDGKVLGMVAEASEGSMRGALTMLAKVDGITNLNDVADLLRTPLDNAEVIDLCRLLMQGNLGWTKLTSTLKALADTPAETIRIVVTNYLAACAMTAKSDKDAQRILDMLECFSKPFNASDKMAPVLLAFGRYIYG